MRIGIITFWQSKDNYGQLLQCWALQQYLRKKGHEPFLIRYNFIGNQRKPNSFRYLKMFLIYPVVKKIWNVIEKKRNLRSWRYYEERNNERKFADFIENHIICSDIVYNNLSELRSMPPLADCYITGSDQVWAQTLEYEDNKAFFLSFGDKKIRRVAYAPSFAMLDYPNHLLFDLKRELSGLDFISVREQSGCNICESIGIYATNVLDPTLLLDKTDYIPKLLKPVAHHEYIYIYSINIASAEEIRWTELKRCIDENKHQLIVTPASGYLVGKELFGKVGYSYATIEEWFSYIYYSNLVVTTSFHGVVFCILLEKPFVYIPLKGKYSGGNSRILDLLDELELGNRVLSDEVTYGTIINHKVDWIKVRLKLSEMRNKSISFLKEALQ